MDIDDNDLGNVSSLGLGRILAESGVDPASLDSFFGRSAATAQIAQVEAESDDDAKYMDDVSDSELPEENDEEKQRRQQQQVDNKAAEDRYMKKALEMQRQMLESGVKVKKEKEQVDESTKVKQIWPEFEPGKPLKMSEIFYETPSATRAYEANLSRKKRRRMEDTDAFNFFVQPRPPSPSSIFQLSSLPEIDLAGPSKSSYETKLGANFDRQWVREAKAHRRSLISVPPPGIDPTFAEHENMSLRQKGPRPLDYAKWEKDIIMCSLDPVPKKSVPDIMAPRNYTLESGEWLKGIIWDSRRISPGIMESDEEDQEESQTRNKPPVDANSKLDPFNISNDHLYEHSRESRFRIRQTFGAIEVFHSGPAKILQLPFYKTSLTKAEARSWRRPALQFPVGVTLTFSKLKSNPTATVSSKKKQILADPSERFKSTKDLTMTEKGPLVLLEFSEEYPPIMSGYGMGTTIVNYYRKQDDKDEHVPKLELGQPSILNVGDAEPFLLGYVDRGRVTQVIHNNLIRAPIFRHQPETTDFLMIRQTIDGHSTYHLRSIPHLYTVGQTVPNESEVPGPHARKNTNTAKLRLQIIAWLLLDKSKTGRLKLSKLNKYFPDQTELKMRQRLNIKGNEFLDYARGTAPNQGHWKLSDTYDFPKDRKVVQLLCTPEAAMLYEAMLVGQRHLYDAGYAKTAEGNASEEFDDEAGLDIEQQLAVWSTTLNYKKAEAQKAWLIVHGEGDPTGRGEGFSFIRTNMKSYFLRAGETEQGRRLEAQRAAPAGSVIKISNAEQGRIYEEEKRRVWDLQCRALSNPISPTVTAEDEAKTQVQPHPPVGFGPRFVRTDSRRAFSRGESMTATPMHVDSPRDMSPSAHSMDESTFTGNPSAGKVMRISRLVKGKLQHEIVRDPAVIQAYLRRVEDKKLDDYQRQAEQLRPSGDAAEDELKKAAMMREIERLKKNQQRRMARKKYSARELEPVEGDVEGKRKCGACGQIGHTKANRNCPMFNMTTSNRSPASSTPQAATPAYDYFSAPTTSGEGLQTPSTSFKIRLGGGK
ncbi:transcription initiation factor TFIID subunit 1 [Tremella mesenterica]|uniref:Transcription initiation factor TFIID subunit 1 n=1 Tax=Tremella mesenterica TaxID=5217 RepID=A0A4V1M4Z4_TREME|nr:transcription initiation factor TFIID subunit 1 [Tremella mesenterica]